MRITSEQITALSRLLIAAKNSYGFYNIRTAFSWDDDPALGDDMAGVFIDAYFVELLSFLRAFGFTDYLPDAEAILQRQVEILQEQPSTYVFDGLRPLVSVAFNPEYTASEELVTALARLVGTFTDTTKQRLIEEVANVPR